MIINKIIVIIKIIIILILIITTITIIGKQYAIVIPLKIFCRLNIKKIFHIL